MFNLKRLVLLRSFLRRRRPHLRLLHHSRLSQHSHLRFHVLITLLAQVRLLCLC